MVVVVLVQLPDGSYIWRRMDLPGEGGAVGGEGAGEGEGLVGRGGGGGGGDGDGGGGRAGHVGGGAHRGSGGADRDPDLGVSAGVAGIT